MIRFPGTYLLAATLVSVALSGCSSSIYKTVPLTASTAKFQISMTGWLVDEAGTVTPARTKDVGRFSFSTPGCVTKVDLSDAINTQVSGANGQAITRLEIQAQHGSGCVSLTATGNIVRVEPAAGGTVR